MLSAARVRYVERELPDGFRTIRWPERVEEEPDAWVEMAVLAPPTLTIIAQTEIPAGRYRLRVGQI